MVAILLIAKISTLKLLKLRAAPLQNGTVNSAFTKIQNDGFYIADVFPLIGEPYAELADRRVGYEYVAVCTMIAVISTCNTDLFPRSQYPGGSNP